METNLLWNRRLVVVVRVTQSRATLATPWPVARQAPLSMGFFRQEYWSGLPFPSPGESSRPRNRTQVSCTAGRFFTNWAMRELKINCTQNNQDDAGQTTDDQFQGNCQSWLLLLHVAPSLSPQRSCPLIVSGWSRPLDRRPLSSQSLVTGIQNKTNFPFCQPGLCNSFWAASRQTWVQ